MELTRILVIGPTEVFAGGFKMYLPGPNEQPESEIIVSDYEAAFECSGTYFMTYDLIILLEKSDGRYSTLHGFLSDVCGFKVGEFANLQQRGAEVFQKP